jgi:hypothetical protein
MKDKMTDDVKPSWLSWDHKHEYGEFELSSPWLSFGYGGEYKTICATIRTTSLVAAELAIIKCYDDLPTSLEFRFVVKPSEGWSNRFPESH